MKMEIATFSDITRFIDPIRYTEFWYPRACLIILRLMYVYVHLILIDERSEISVMSEQGARELNCAKRHADWRMILADGNLSNLTKVAALLPLHVNGIVIHISIFFEKSSS